MFLFSPSSLPQIFTELKGTIERVDAEADLKKWSFAHGVDMVANFPTFEVSLAFVLYLSLSVSFRFAVFFSSLNRTEVSTLFKACFNSLLGAREPTMFQAWPVPLFLLVNHIITFHLINSIGFTEL